MWHDMMTVGIPIAEKVIRTALVYVVVLALFRISGKRGLANLNTFDMAVVFLLSNVVQNAVIGPDDSLLGGVIGAVTLVLLNAAMNRWLALDERVGRVLEGTPTTVVEDGEFDRRAALRLSLRRAELENAVRMQKGDKLSDVASASLEPSGQLVIVLKPTESNATRGDIARVEDRLAAIEALLRSRGPG
ncbi:hypothetical protein BJF79_18325 [Actinomadura sp. CNU-125]|uniref:DUF421 domain-containing protein n=1 Tax=Actinomadura sp. CNU-125 TaxID=1904961 RepID=UPI00095BD0BE|nr:YetF domain-containing protein [Actinomadura sp. CNU-125]OLT16574.1 hypothetical protein BJF79_18325 [Actinomadura sp. CNU-125]